MSFSKELPKPEHVLLQLQTLCLVPLGQVSSTTDQAVMTDNIAQRWMQNAGFQIPQTRLAKAVLFAIDRVLSISRGGERGGCVGVWGDVGGKCKWVGVCVGVHGKHIRTQYKQINKGNLDIYLLNACCPVFAGNSGGWEEFHVRYR